jgi:hypothetical protein
MDFKIIAGGGQTNRYGCALGVNVFIKQGMYYT